MTVHQFWNSKGKIGSAFCKRCQEWHQDMLPGGWLSLFNPPHTDWIWHHCMIYHHCNKVLYASRSYPMEKSWKDVAEKNI